MTVFAEQRGLACRCDIAEIVRYCRMVNEGVGDHYDGLCVGFLEEYRTRNWRIRVDAGGSYSSSNPAEGCDMRTEVFFDLYQQLKHEIH